MNGAISAGVAATAPAAASGSGGSAAPGIGGLTSTSPPAASSDPTAAARIQVVEEVAPPATFAWSSPAEVFRSVQKDEYHLTRFREEVSDLASSLLGSSATSFEPEIDLVTRSAYYGCTSLLGRTTLGEEYTDLMQVTPVHPHRAFEQQHRQERASQRARRTDTTDSAAAAAASTASSSDSAAASASAGVTSLAAASPVYAWAEYAPFQLLSVPHRAALFSLQVLLPYAYEKAQQHSRRLLFSVPSDSSAFGAGGYRLVEMPSESPWTEAQLRLKRLWNRLLNFALRTDYTLVNHALRLHLALFYLFGRYLEVSKRVSGVRYIQLRSFEVARPGYQLFGALLLLQVCVGIGKLLRQVLSAYAASAAARAREEEEELSARPLVGLHASPLIPPDGSASGLYALEPEEIEDNARDRFMQAPQATHRTHLASPQVEEESDEEEEEAPNCMLCLCPRENTTATECGHLYCWSCICEACTNKPECPMCRQPCALNTLLLLAHYK